MAQLLKYAEEANTSGVREMFDEDPFLRVTTAFDKAVNKYKIHRNNEFISFIISKLIRLGVADTAAVVNVNNVKLAQICFQYGAKVNMKMLKDVIEKGGSPSLLKELLRCDIDLNHKFEDHKTEKKVKEEKKKKYFRIADLAVNSGKKEIIKMILIGGIKPLIKENMVKIAGKCCYIINCTDSKLSLGLLINKVLTIAGSSQKQKQKTFK